MAILRSRLMFCGRAKYGVSSQFAVSIHALPCLACLRRVAASKCANWCSPDWGEKGGWNQNGHPPPSPLKPAVQATSYLAQIYWPPPLCTSKFEQLCKSPQSILQILVPWATRRKYWGCCILEEGGGSLSARLLEVKGTTSSQREFEGKHPSW